MNESLEMISNYDLESKEKILIISDLFNIKIRKKNYKMNGKIFFIILLMFFFI